MSDVIQGDIDINTNLKEVISEIKKSTEAVGTFAQSFSAVTKQADDVAKHISNIVLEMTKLRESGDRIKNDNRTQTFSKTEHKHQTKVYGAGKAKRSLAMGDVVITENSDITSQAYQDLVKKSLEEAEIELQHKRKINSLLAAEARERTSKAKKRESEARTRDRELDIKDKRAEASLINARANASGVSSVLRSPRVQFGNAISDLGRNISAKGGEFRVVGDIVDVAGRLLKSPIAGLAAVTDKATKGLSDFAEASVKAYAEIESIRTQLGVVFSSQTQANSMFADIAQYSVRSPFGVNQVSDMAVQLKQSGVYAGELMDTLRMIGDTAGGNVEKMKRIAMSYSQVVAIGKASMRDMRKFAYAGLPIFEAVSKEMGVSQARLKQLLADGKVTAEVLENTFKNMTSMGGVFYEATEKGARTLKARLQNLSDARSLMLSTVGKGLVNFGASRTENGESYLKNLVSWAEKIYQFLYKVNNKTGIKTDEGLIQDWERRVEALELRLAEARESGNVDLIRLLESMLDTEKAKYDSESIRGTYSEGYRAKADDYYRFKEQGYVMNREVIRDMLDNLNFSNIGVTERDEAFNAQKEVLEKLLKAIEDFNSLTQEEKYHYQVGRALEAQSRSVDLDNKAANRSESMSNVFDKLAQIKEGLPEEKEKAEQEEVKILKKGLEELKKLVDISSEENGIDVTKLSVDKYIDYSKKGALTSEKQYSLNGEGLSGKERTAARNLMQGQLEWAMKFLRASLPSQYELEKQEGGARLSSHMWDDRALAEMSDANFFKFLPIAINQLSEGITEFSKTLNPSEEQNWISLLGDIRDIVVQGIGKRSTVNGTGSTLAGADLENSVSKITIPLWKRLLGSYTGLSPSAIDTSSNAISAYQNNISTRSIAAGVFGQMLRGGSSTRAITQMLSAAGENATLARDSGKTQQISWEGVRRNLENFSLALSSSTDVITSYKAGLEAELETLIKIAAEGTTAFETSDPKGKTVSLKTYEGYLKSTNEQLVNAFGENLVDELGEAVTMQTVDGKNRFYRSNGQEISIEEVRVQSNLLKKIQETIEKTRQDLISAERSEMLNKAMENALSSVSGNFLNTLAFANMGNNSARYFANNQQDVMRYFNSVLINLKANNSKYAEKSNKDIITDAVRGDKVAIQLLSDVFKTIETGIEGIVNSEAYGKLAGGKYLSTTDAEVNSLISSMQFQKQLDKYNEATGLNARNRRWVFEDGSYDITEYGGVRGARNKVARELGFTGNYDAGSLVTKILENPEVFGTTEAKVKDSKRAYDYVKENKTKDYMGQGYDSAEAEALARVDAEQAVLGLMDKQTMQAAQRLAYEQEEAKALREMGNAVTSALVDAGKQAYLAPFEEMGEALVTGEFSAKQLAANLKQVGAAMLKNVGAAMTTAGFQIAGAAAVTQQWGMVAMGLGLAAAGGIVSGIGGALSKDQSEQDRADSRAEKLEKLKDSLVDLLKQAKEDAVYYENTMRHRNAISANEAFKTQKVNDAVITPSGKVISTAPDDYLIATKTPETLMSGRGGAPKINFTVVDKSTGIIVKEQRSSYDEEKNEVNFEAVIESKIAEFIATSKGDEAFGARQARLDGRRVTA